MDLGTILTATIMLSICILPFILMNRRKKKRIKQLYHNFMTYASSNNLTIGQHEVCGDFALGLDNTSKYILFIKQSKSTNTELCIPIDNVSSCQLEKIYDADNNNKGHFSLDKISLIFQPKDFGSSSSELVLYDSKDQMQLDGELQLGEKWINILKAIIK